ncbi:MULTISPECIES: NUDIX hydrolase [Prochlorococcus]|uniref:NUDIX/MutT family pyrophosphohydrolase n=1 Tax=Prochlorococcus marinus (strain SARG / CCMP1375 / SS120) TaxID=167539 RepID=Q7VDQ1_PROMA|nr:MULTISPECIES: NUDIX hydrolase [Prochlorococcus]AAP99363.1 NUDIX/MutT family pyrophosphohydrolase [Prochlorococcus marinus subsp. marinus str. CCMP1375]KGG11366.1 ADP-ribose pyrophosphatasee [Prochlorococcus marinus str. LG]KGG18679.1 ADP-ribose pyrophosphatasee [Prochlorococcus marinus str. SS2]KGG22952.1 ADP-ribose pyrophosphatasee [Prochlorococcus marinus str. SS35]KGG34056.1 ADP-ribose pyrophosphatasee [Prochlorococcus marinus str. SS51]
MSPLSQQEPSKILENIQALDSKKIRFEINRFELPIGVEGTFGVIKHPGAALAVPIKENGNVIVLRQYRFAISRRILEFPAGTLEPNEAPLKTIQRELQEESGYKASKWDSLGVVMPCPGYSDEIIHLYLAREIEPLLKQPSGDEDEDIEVLEMTTSELEDCIASGNEALDGKSVTAWHRACQVLKP